MKEFLKNLSNERGVSFVELILAMLVTSIMASTAGYVLSGNMESYGHLKSRQDAMQDARYALNRANQEIMRLDIADIDSVESDAITFTDSDGNATSYSIGTTADNETALLRGADVMIAPLSTGSIVAYDADGNVTTDMNQLRRIAISVGTEEVNNEGEILLTTSVVPRSLYYASYE